MATIYMQHIPYFLQEQMLSCAVVIILSKHYSLHDYKLIVFKKDVRD